MYLTFTQMDSPTTALVMKPEFTADDESISYYKYILLKINLEKG